MSSLKLIGLPRLACCALLLVLSSSCSDPPEMLEYKKDTDILKDVVRDARQEVTKTRDQLRELELEKRAWEKDTKLSELREEVNELKAARDAAKAEVVKVEEQFEAMKSARLP